MDELGTVSGSFNSATLHSKISRMDERLMARIHPRTGEGAEWG